VTPKPRPGVEPRGSGGHRVVTPGEAGPLSVAEEVLELDVARRAVEEGRSGFRHLLRYRDFRLIWYAQVAAQLADKFLMFSLIILAYGLSGGSTPVAITLLAYTVPAVVIAPVAGVVADRHDRKLIMVGTNLIRAGLVAMIPLASFVPVLGHDYVHLLLITLAFAAVGQLFSPAEAAAIPSVIPRGVLLTANSMVLGTMVLTLVLGGALAPITSRAQIYAPYWIAVVLFGLAGVLIAMARIPRPVCRTEPVRRHPFHQLAVEMSEGLDVLRRSRVLMLAFFEVSLTVLVMFMMFTLAPAYVSQVLRLGNQDSYMILVPATVGALASAAAIGQLGRRLGPAQLLVGGLMAMGLTLVVLAVIPALVLPSEGGDGVVRAFAVAISLLLGLEFGALMIPALAYLMEHTSDQVRGRIFALLFMVINGVTALPVLIAAALSDWLGTTKVVAGLGVLLVIAGLFLADRARRILATRSGDG